MPTTLELTITGMAQGGTGVARSAGKVVFVAGALPHERVLAQITQETAAYMRGHVLEVYEPAPERVEPRLPHADHLLWQHIAYPAQLQFKQTILREQVQKLARLAEPPIAPMLPRPTDMALPQHRPPPPCWASPGYIADWLLCNGHTAGA